MTYVDAYILAVPRDKVEDYKEIARQTADFWMQNGATSYVETVADDAPYGEKTSFPRAVLAEDGEVVVLSWITYPSKSVRDAAVKKMMEDEDMQKVMQDIPTDGSRMVFGGFEAFLER